MCLIIEKRLRKDQDTYIAFIDLEMAFDKVNWQELFKMLKEIGVKDRRVMRNLYKDEVAVVRCGEHHQTRVNIRQGIKIGCSLSPVLFIGYIQGGLD